MNKKKNAHNRFTAARHITTAAAAAAAIANQKIPISTAGKHGELKTIKLIEMPFPFIVISAR